MPTKRRIAKSICLFVLLLVIGCTAPPKVKVDVLPGFDALFDNRKGWTGADGAYSLPLSDDSTLWLFGDTWLGDIRDGAHVNATIVNNTVAIQHGLFPSNAAVEFYFGKTPIGNPGPFIRWIYISVRK